MSRPENMDNHVRITTSPEQFIEWLQEYLAVGFTHLTLHNVNIQHEQTIETFAEKVIPQIIK